jgi:GNAT superfamily N-acetyltransferase
MDLRPAEFEDLQGCAAMSRAVSSGYVWQLTLARDPAAALAASELNIMLRCLRLPRQVVVEPPGEPLDVIWHRATAVFVAEDDAMLHGFIALTAVDERPAAHIARIVVIPGARQRGTGTALLRTAADWAQDEGLAGLTAHCSARNHPAVAFFTHAGFTFSGYSEAYYPRGEVALFWQRGLELTPTRSSRAASR